MPPPKIDIDRIGEISTIKNWKNKKKEDKEVQPDPKLPENREGIENTHPLQGLKNEPIPPRVKRKVRRGFRPKKSASAPASDDQGVRWVRMGFTFNSSRPEISNDSCQLSQQLGSTNLGIQQKRKRTQAAIPTKSSSS